MIRYPAFSYYAVVIVSSLVFQPVHAKTYRRPDPPVSTAGCCVGQTGNIDCSAGDGVDIGDLTSLIDNLFISFNPLCCEAEANTDGQGGTDIGDLTALIDNLFIGFTPTANCAGGVGTGDIIITEIMPDPVQILDADGEWFELYNTSATETFDMNGMTITGSSNVSFTISGALTIAPHSYRVLARSESAGFVADYLYSTVTLPNTNGLLKLSSGAQVIDQVSYSTGANGFPTLAPGKSLTLKAAAYDAVSNDAGANWCLDGTHVYSGVEHGTPKAVNTPCP